MKKSFLAIICTTLFLVSCTKDKTKASTEPEKTPVADSTNTSTASPAAKNDLIKSTAKDKNGKTLEMTFDNAKNTVTVVFEGNTVTLQGQEAGSGMLYKNEQYELSGKGEQVKLAKEGKTIFEN